MMRPSRARGKPAIAQLDKLTAEQLEAMLEANNRTLNSSHFASSSTSQPDPVTLRLLDNNARIQARLAHLRSVQDISAQLAGSALEPALPTSPRPDAARRGSHLSKADEDEAIAHERAEKRARRLQDVVDQHANGFSSGGLKILSPHKTEQLEREEAARSPHSQGLTTSASTRDLLRGASSLEGRPAPDATPTDGRGVYDELSHIEKAARMRSFLQYGPSDSDLEWEMDEDDASDASADPDAWLAADSDDGERGEHDAHMASSGLVSLSGSTPDVSLPLPNGAGAPAGEDDAMLGLERIIRVEVERIDASGGTGGEGGGLAPPARSR